MSNDLPLFLCEITSMKFKKYFQWKECNLIFTQHNSCLYVGCVLIQCLESLNKHDINDMLVRFLEYRGSS